MIFFTFWLLWELLPIFWLSFFRAYVLLLDSGFVGFLAVVRGKICSVFDGDNYSRFGIDFYLRGRSIHVDLGRRCLNEVAQSNVCWGCLDVVPKIDHVDSSFLLLFWHYPASLAVAVPRASIALRFYRHLGGADFQ